MFRTDAHERPSFDRMLDALGSRRRRHLLLNLSEKNPLHEAKLVDELEFEDEEEEPLLSLRHIHLPKLDDLGYIDWDRETGEIVKGPAFEEIRPLIEVLVRHAEELPDDVV